MEGEQQPGHLNAWKENWCEWLVPQRHNDSIQVYKQTRMVRVKRKRSSPWRKIRTGNRTRPILCLYIQTFLFFFVLWAHQTETYLKLISSHCKMLFQTETRWNQRKPTQTHANLCEKVHRKAVSLHHQTHTSCTQRKVNFFSFYPSYNRFELVSVWWECFSDWRIWHTSWHTTPLWW